MMSYHQYLSACEARIARQVKKVTELRAEFEAFEQHKRIEAREKAWNDKVMFDTLTAESTEQTFDYIMA